jgi:hypothetical protein
MSSEVRAPLLGEKKERPTGVREERMRLLRAYRNELIPGSLSATKAAAREVKEILDDAEKHGGVTEEEAEVIAETREFIEVALERDDILDRPGYVTMYYDFLAFMGWDTSAGKSTASEG